MSACSAAVSGPATAVDNNPSLMRTIVTSFFRNPRLSEELMPQPYESQWW
jgi:hypothetical protein